MRKSMDAPSVLLLELLLEGYDRRRPAGVIAVEVV